MPTMKKPSSTIGVNTTRATMIATTVTVITMTLNEILRQVGSFILALLGGILSGLISTSIFHKRTRKNERTKIVISPKIARRYLDAKRSLADATYSHFSQPALCWINQYERPPGMWAENKREIHIGDYYAVVNSLVPLLFTCFICRNSVLQR